MLGEKPGNTQEVRMRLTIALAALWPFVFPALARIDRLEHLLPQAAPPIPP